MWKENRQIKGDKQTEIVQMLKSLAIKPIGKYIIFQQEWVWYAHEKTDKTRSQ